MIEIPLKSKIRTKFPKNEKLTKIPLQPKEKDRNTPKT